MAEDDKQHYESIEMLDKSFKKLLGRAKTEEEPTIRAEWTAAKAAFWDRIQNPPPPPPDPEEEARAEAHRRYGYSAASSGAIRHVYADPPTPITVNPRPVEVTSEEGE